MSNLRSVRSAILRPALRAMVVETSLTPAPDDAYSYAFDEYVNMLEEWAVLDEIQLCACIPSDMDNEVGAQDPVYPLWTALLVRIADYFAYTPTQKQMAQASASERKLRSRPSLPPRVPPMRNQPRGSGNTWNNWCEPVRNETVDCSGPFECK